VSKINKKMIAVVAFGSGFEYYDFVIYALFINIISKQFFSIGDSTHSLIWAVTVFATGYLARPVGGIVFGLLGDKFGRKPTFFASMLLMSFATLIMGLAPGFQTAGIAGTIIFAGARFLQGLSYGAEMPGAMVYVAESSAKDKHSSSCALMLTGACLGVTLATLVYWLSITFISTQDLADWGWRIPFLFGFALAIVALVFRKKMLETKAFRENKNQRQSLRAVFGALDIKKPLFAVLLLLFPASYVLLNTLFLPVYVLHTETNITSASVAMAMFVGNLWCALLLPRAGAIIDQYDRIKFFGVLLVIVLAVNPILFWILHQQTLAGLYVFVIVNQTILAFIAPTYMVFIPELFAVSVRLTAVGLVYNTAYCLASFVPMILFWLDRQRSSMFDGGMIFFELLALLSLVVSYRLEKSMINKNCSVSD
jgi:MHS family proline/betaine transporter-like MFS transporter